MSVWTHVTGILNLDAIGLAMGTQNWESVKSLVKKAFGPISLYYEDPGEYPPDSMELQVLREGLRGDAPVSGSEGSWVYLPIRVGTRSSLNNIVIPFYGNLRDFGSEPSDLNKLVDVIKKGIKMLEEEGILVRGLVFFLESEMGFSKLLWKQEDHIHVMDILE